jgi:hypothetical protein
MQAWFNIQNSTFLKVAVLGLLTFHLEYLHWSSKVNLACNLTFPYSPYLTSSCQDLI